MLTMAIPYVEICMVLICSPDGANVYSIGGW